LVVFFHIPIQYAIKITMWDCIWYDAPTSPSAFENQLQAVWLQCDIEISIWKFQVIFFTKYHKTTLHVLIFKKYWQKLTLLYDKVCLCVTAISYAL